jgi:hypothetical protein
MWSEAGPRWWFLRKHPLGHVPLVPHHQSQAVPAPHPLISPGRAKAGYTHVRVTSNKGVTKCLDLKGQRGRWEVAGQLLQEAPQAV